MATLDRQIQSPDTFLCKPWSSFVFADKLRFVDNSTAKNGDAEPRCLGEAKELSKQEMHVCSPFPSLEDFSLVVCHVCNQVVAPLGIHAHYEKRHGSPAPSRSLLVPMKPKAPAVAPNAGDTLAFRVPKDYPHSRFSKAPLAVYPPKGARNKTCLPSVLQNAKDGVSMSLLGYCINMGMQHGGLHEGGARAHVDMKGSVQALENALIHCCSVSLPVVSLEKMPCLTRDSGSHVRLTPSSSSPHSLKAPCLTPPLSQRSGEKLMNGRVGSGLTTPQSATPSSSLDRRPSPAHSPLDRRASSTPSPSSLDRKPTTSPSPSQRSGPPSSSPIEKKHQNGNKGSSSSHKRLSERVFDPNKHCGVQDPETSRPCTRSLTCKTHSLSQRRAVPGRRKQFDVLLAEHKGRAKDCVQQKEKDRDGARDGCGQNITSQESASPSKPHCPNGRPLSTLKLRLANAHIPRHIQTRVPGSITSTSSPLPPAPAPALAHNPEPSLHSSVTAAGDGGRLSSDDGDAETPEDGDKPAFHCSSHHPRPLGYCVFSSRLMGRGHYVFDRRWDRIRLALQNMVEKHLNAQMWRKVPLAAESLLALSSSTSSTTSQQPLPPSPTSVAPPLVSTPSSLFSYTATFPQSASMAGVFSIRDPPQPLAPVSTAGKARNGPHKASRQSKETEDSLAGCKKRKNASTSFSSSLFPTVDNHKRNGSSYNQGPRGTAANPARKKGLGRGGGSSLWSRREDWVSRADGSQSHNSHNSRDLGTISVPYSLNRDPASTLHQPPAPPSGPLAYRGGAEGWKRRSPSSYRGKASKLSRTDGIERLFGNDGGGILASRPDSPIQVKMHH